MKKLTSAVIFAAVALTGYAKTVVYPAPAECRLNDSFSLDIRQGDGAWQPVDIYAIKVDKTEAGKHKAVFTSMAYFDFDGTVDVRVISHRQKVQEAKVRPLSYNITPACAGDTLTFSLDRPRQLSVEVNGEIFDNLHIFANPIDRNVPVNLKKWRKNKDNLYFGPGYHKLDSVMKVGSGKNVYIAGGAWVDGTIIVSGDNVKVSGRGMVYPAKGRAGIEVQRSNDVEIEGIFSTQCPVGQSNRVHVENVKVMSSYGWGDGFNVFASNDVSYNDIFARTSDDCTTVYATRLGYEGGVDNVKVEGAVLWADVAHPFMIGLHGNPEKPDTIQNILYKDIDVLDCNELQTDYQGIFAIITGDNNLVRNVTFEDIRVENFRKSKLFDIRIAYNKKYCGAPGNSIENINFNNITYNGDNSELSLIIGYDDQRIVNGVHFRNLVINGRHLHDKMEGKPGWYKTSDFVPMYIGEHVENVTFE